MTFCGIKGKPALTYACIYFLLLMGEVLMLLLF